MLCPQSFLIISTHKLYLKRGLKCNLVCSRIIGMLMENSQFAIEVKGLVKSFGKVQALKGVDLIMEKSTVLALLGPNGAGKTTLIRILTTLLKPDSGTAKVFGLDCLTQAAELRNIIGLAGQYAAIDENLTGRENLHLVGKLYHLPKTEYEEKTEILLAQFELLDAASRTAKTYSGGMRRRLDLAASLVGNPKILFLDEPTTGLDPRSRIALWNIIKKLVAGGTTLLLTTQYLEEADRLADKIGVIDHGKVIAFGTSEELKSKVGGEVLELLLKDQNQIPQALATIKGLGVGEPQVHGGNGEITLPVSEGTATLVEIIRRLDNDNIEIANIFLRRPTLDDVFLTLTGHISE